MIFEKRQKRITKTAPAITAEELEDLPYADNFDLPREEGKLRAVYEHERAGGDFDIRKVFAAKGIRAKTIATVAQFPAYQDLVDMFEEQFGGGVYNVHAVGSARILKSYIIDGPPTYNIGRPHREKSTTQKRKEELEEVGWRCLRDAIDDDPRLGEAIGMAFAKQYLGIELPAELDWEEKLVREEAEVNREYKDELVKAGLRKRGVEFPEDRDLVEEQIGKFEQLQRLSDALGAGRKGETSTWINLVEYLGPVLPEIVTMINEIRGVGEARQVGPALQTPPNQPQAESPVGQDPLQTIPPVSTVQSATPAPQPETDSMPEATGQTPPVEQLADGPIDQSHNGPRLNRLDWAELEAGVHGDPGEFIQGVYITAYEQDSLYHHQLARLFHDDEPDAILAELSRLVESLAVGSGEEYEVAVSVLKYLAESEEGRVWLAQAHMTAQVIQEKLDEHAASKLIAERPERTESDGEGLDEDEDFGGPMLI